MIRKIYEKVLENLIKFKGDHRKEFLASFLAGVLTDGMKSFAALVRKKLGIPLLFDYYEAYGKMSWWFFNDELRKKMLEAFKYALSNSDYRWSIIELAKDGARTRILEAMKYVKEIYPDDPNVRFVLEEVKNLRVEDKEFKPKFKGTLRATFIALAWSIDDLAIAFQKKYIKFIPRKDQIELPDEVVNISEDCVVRAKILCLNLGFIEEEKGASFYEAAKYLLIIVPRDGRERVIEFIKRWHNSFKKVEVFGFVLLSNDPLSFDRDLIKKFEKVPIFISNEAQSILYNVALIALEKEEVKEE